MARFSLPEVNREIVMLAIIIAAIAVVISVVTLIYHVTSEKRVTKAVTAFVVSQTTQALSAWAKNFEGTAEQVIKMMIAEELTRQTTAAAAATKTPAARAKK
jgi:hypothetical protein